MIIKCGFAEILLIMFTIFTVGTSVGQTEVNKLKCICIDAGHGGSDPGACGLQSREKDIVLKLALKVGKLIEQAYPEIKVVYTRKTDVLIDLSQRGQIANNHHADLFISIHINSNELRSPHGLETYVLGLHRTKENLAVAMKENSVIKYEEDYSTKYAGFDPSRPESYIMFSLMQNLYLEKSLELAALVQEEMVAATKRSDRGVRQAGYIVLVKAAMPAILIEAGFISNPEEERYLLTQTGQNKIATAIFKAIQKYKMKVEKQENIILVEKKREKNTTPEQAPVKMPEPRSTASLQYAVQVAPSTAKVKDVSRLCPGEKVGVLVSGGRYRYYVRPGAELEEVKKSFSKIKNKVKDCFIIGIYDGKAISVAEAKKLEQTRK